MYIFFIIFSQPFIVTTYPDQEIMCMCIYHLNSDSDICSTHVCKNTNVSVKQEKLCIHLGDPNPEHGHVARALDIPVILQFSGPNLIGVR